MFHLCHTRLWLVVLVVSLAAGCGDSSSTVTGEVTYDGQPVGDGMITFLPADGKGPPAGGRIANGRYSVTGVPPGPKIVQINAVKSVQFARSSAEMEKMAAAAKAKGNATGIVEPADVIPPDAVGNNNPLEVKPGKQTHIVILKKPEKKTR